MHPNRIAPSPHAGNEQNLPSLSSRVHRLRLPLESMCPIAPIVKWHERALADCIDPCSPLVRALVS